MAVEMDANAAACGDLASRADYVEMAICWRNLARMANYQDQWTADRID